MQTQAAILLNPDHTPVILPTLADMQAQTQALMADAQAQTLALLAGLRTPSTRLHSLTVDLSAVQADLPLDLGGLTVVQTVVIKTLSVATASMRFGGLAETPIPLLQSEVRDNLAVSELYLSTPGAVGGTLTLELHGR